MTIDTSSVDTGIWVSAIGGSIWISTIGTIVRIGQPWLSFSVGVRRSLANVVSTSESVTVVSMTIDTGSIDTSIWVSSMGIGGSSIWISTIGTIVRIGQPWLSFGVRFGLSEYAGNENG